MYRYFTVFLFSILFSNSVFAQAKNIHISDIVILGNHKTKEKVVLRELDFQVGDSLYLADLDNHFHNNKLQILGTGLFNDVTLNLINYKVSEASGIIQISLEENWYLFPVPIFELADRNFSVWWEEQGRSLSRVNYGLRLGHYNFSGNRDPLKLKIQFGYTRKYELTYSIPYLAMDNKLGVAGSIFYSENREIAYQTVANKTLFNKQEDERRMLARFRIGPEIKYRPTRTLFHSLRFEYHHNKVADIVAEELNPDYFLDGRTDLRFFYLEYDITYDKRLYNHYPQGGFLLFANIKKEGLGFLRDYNNLSLGIGAEKHHMFRSKLIFSTRNKAKMNLNRNVVAFANNTGLGWSSDIVSGYELYVMDGTDYFISMNNLKYKFVDRNLNTVRWLPKQFRKMHITLFLRTNLDAAYVNERTYIETNTLNNRWIYGYGPALDILLFNNFLFSFEYSFNDIGERGLFFHNTIAF